MATEHSKFARWLGVLVALAGLVVPSSALAFKENGHRAIEAAAYARLIDTGNAAALARLVRAGILQGPVAQTHLKPHLPPPDDECRPPKHAGVWTKKGDPPPLVPPIVTKPHEGLGDELESVEGLRIVSNLPDHSFERQLQSYGQCFHFMARAADVTSTVGSDYGVPVGLKRDAYERCVGLADGLLRGILHDAKDSSKRKLDVYALIHLVTDSFSSAHTERDSNWNILYLKPWRLRTWVPYVLAPRGWKYHVSDTHHGGLSEPRDDEWREESCNACDEGVLSAACLTPRGRRAADAVAELLLLIAHTVDCDEAKTTSECDFETNWNDYKSRHLAHADPTISAVLTADQLHSGLRSHALMGSSAYLELSPPPTLGIGLATDLGGPSRAIWIDADVFAIRDPFARSEIGFWDFVTWSLQLRVPLEDDAGQRPFGAAVDFGFRVPSSIIEVPYLTGYLGVHLVRASYTIASVAPGIARHIGEVGFGGLGLDLILLDRVWLGVTFPRKLARFDSWSSPTWEDTFWTLKAGGAINAF